ncbi:MAG: hypothetical protein ABI647_08970 [Gemmatimonadota bacterium]
MRWTLLALTVAACSKPAPKPTGPTPGTLSVSWTGSQTGKFEARAEGNWCPADSVLEITATRGDTGVGVSLFAVDTVKPAQLPIISPAVNVTWRPISMAAVRWFNEKDVEIVGFEGATGSVTVTDVVGDKVSATFDWRMRIPGRVDSLIVKGRLTQVPYRGDRKPCGRLTHQPKTELKNELKNLPPSVTKKVATSGR